MSEHERPSIASPDPDRFLDASRIYHDFLQTHFSEALEAHRKANPTSYVPVSSIHVDSENLKKPRPGYFVLYTDILGFSEGVAQGSDSLPDFYGAAWVGASRHREIRVYVLSDTCLAACIRKHGDSLFEFAGEYSGNLQADGILHQTYIGYGTFVERRPEYAGSPPNLLGTQVVGTAIVNAAAIAKSRPLGSRILVSSAALAKASSTQRLSILRLSSGEAEYLPARAPQSDLFDCIYYCLCLRDHVKDSRPYQHYIWSLASRTRRLGGKLARIAIGLAAQSDSTLDARQVAISVNEVLRIYADPPSANPD